jgi:hypothetical protein
MVEWVGAKCNSCGWTANAMLKSKAEKRKCPCKGCNGKLEPHW